MYQNGTLHKFDRHTSGNPGAVNWRGQRQRKPGAQSVIRELAGHIDPAMTRYYSHPRLAARRAAVETLGTVKAGVFEGGYVTNHVTKELPEAVEVG